MWYHLRVSLNERPDAEGVIEYYLEAFPVKAYIFAYEEKDDNKHMHAHIMYDDGYDPTEPKNKVKRSEFFKKMKKLEFVPDKTESNYHEVCKDEIKNLAYCIKECDIIKELDIPEDMRTLAEERHDRIENEKNQKMKDQLLNAWIPMKRLFTSRLEAFVFIDTYHIDRDYLPPNMTNKIQYALYIIYKIHKLNNYVFDNESYKLIGSFQNINEREVETSSTVLHHMTNNYDVIVKSSQ